MEKLDEAVDHFSVSSKFRNVVKMWLISLCGRFLGSMGLMWAMRGDLCGMSSPGSITSGKYHGV